MAKYKALSQEFAADMKAAVSTGPRKTATLLLYTIALFFVVAVVWASRATVDEVTISMGTVIPTQQVQVVQNLEGGILAEILVAEGDLVEAGRADWKSLNWNSVLSALARVWPWPMKNATLWRPWLHKG